MNTGFKKVRVTSIVFLIFALLVATVNIAYYYSTKRALIQQQNEKISIISDDINIALQLSVLGEKYVEDLIGQNLRTASLVAQAQLDPDIEKVRNEQLAALSKKIGIDHITLMKRAGDDIIGYKSSDPSEINMSTKGWRGYWFTAFDQLLTNKSVNVPVGQTLPNYWAGPINTSQTRTENVDKWGYYFDGTTNYIIDPFVHDTTLRRYQKETGIEAIIKNILQNKNVTGVQEITVFNPPTFLGQQEQYTKNGVVWASDREILFGSYETKDPQDKSYVQKVVNSKTPASYTSTINGKKVMTSFNYASLKLQGKDYPVIIGIDSDLTTINKSVNRQLYQLLGIIAVLSLLCWAATAFAIRLVNRSRETTAQNVQDVYVTNIESLFTSMKEQRHDYNNHVSTIHALVELGEYEELKRYTGEITGETIMMNDIININVPAISALIQSKLAQAYDKRIIFNHEIENLQRFSLGAMKATDFVKIIGNLIDNAFDAVIESESDEKIVTVRGWIEGQSIVFSVWNNGGVHPTND